jgi:FkbM family methyltransferase
MKRLFKVRIFQALRWVFYKYLTTRRRLIVPVLGRPMEVDLRVGGISRALALYGQREEDMLSILRTHVRAGMRVLDLGANIGYYSTEFISLIGETGMLLAVEPDPRNFSLLTYNIGRLGKRNVILKQIAVSNQPGSAKMALSAKSNLNTLVISADAQNNELITVETDTISELASKYLSGRLDFVRMDIEGYEYEALCGLEDYLKLKLNKPAILFEAHPNNYSNERDMSGLLSRLVNVYGYEINVLVSTNGGKKYFDSIGYSPSREMFSDGFLRYFYKELPQDVAIQAIVQRPKCVRYALLV